MVAPRWLQLVALARRHRCAVVLEGAQHDQVELVDERGSSPAEAIDAVAEQRHLQDLSRVRREHVAVEAALFVGEERIGRKRGAAAGPEQIHTRVRREVRVQRDAKEPAFRGAVDAEVEHGPGDCAIDDALDVPGVFFEDEHIVRTQEGHRNRQLETADDRPHLEVRIEDLRGRRCLRPRAPVDCHAARDRDRSGDRRTAPPCSSGHRHLLLAAPRGNHGARRCVLPLPQTA